MRKTVAVLCAICLLGAWSLPLLGGVLTVNPNAGTLSTDGQTWGTGVLWNGVTIQAAGLASDGAREYRVYGDFTVGAGETVTATIGSSVGVRFVVGNNAYLGGTFNFSAGGQQSRAGGGTGGVGGSGGIGPDCVSPEPGTPGGD